MYYKSLLETLKDEGDNRIRVEDEFSSNDEYRVEITLIPKDINICPSCNSTNVIKFGKKDRTIKDDFISNRPTFITLFYNRLKCNNCHKMFNDTLN
ncbi:transposase IS204/IS1001/IS1096/IS1165 family protein [Anaeroplasma bactoclasticum]|jgi:transposase|uniref:Transposase IS204/IS1001/IS1096/IS1165 family protein n=1 Tax=Anaeroplasma bactoclasticum TaxID=2088 RepID=A0A397RTS7_9MOLU|nr:transposase family protein [Anaeroplasma bactoclasticum]RIA77730.1 transposase IS204/IS1001/IS1096/IS1165 family protein [Anaeroplasma bactoclasticum]